MRVTLASLLLICSFAVEAGYVVLGDVRATVCSGFIIESCSQHPVSAVERDGRMYEFGSRFEAVTEYNEAKGRCMIRTDSENVLVAAAQKAMLPNFYTTEGGKLKRIQPEYISFNCAKE